MLLVDHVRSIWVPSTATLLTALFLGATAGVVASLFALGVAREMELDHHRHVRIDVRAANLSSSPSSLPPLPSAPSSDGSWDIS